MIPQLMKKIILLTLLSYSLMAPQQKWERIYFKAIDERAKIAGLSSLRSPLPKDDLELRVWSGFGLTALEGFVLRRTSGQWSAIHLDGITSKSAQKDSQRQLSTPKSGWDEAWRKLVANGILTLPDAMEINCSPMMFDGMTYVVEVNHESTYRTYRYDNPTYAKCDQAKTMLVIGRLIAEEFNVREMAHRQ